MLKGDSRTNPSIGAGELTCVVTIQQQSAAPDVDTGEAKEGDGDWTAVLTTRAKIETVTLREAALGQQFVGQVTHQVTIRWPGTGTTIGPGMRVVFGARNFTIQAAPDNLLERNRVLRLLCMEIDDGQ